MASIFLLSFLVVWVHLNTSVIHRKHEQHGRMKDDSTQNFRGITENGRPKDDPKTYEANADTSNPNKILTFYLEPPNSLTESTPLPMRRTSADILQKIEFPQARVDCSNGFLVQFPTDDFPESDPFLPWIHDYFVDTSDDHNNSNWSVRFVAQNRRRCSTGQGKEAEMKFWEPQMALFQPVPIQINLAEEDSGIKYRLSSLENATVPETRFICRFHDDKGNTEISFSAFPFNYEYINWRKHREQSMFSFKGPDVGLFEFSQLMFSCPVPETFRIDMAKDKNQPRVWMDLIPIRTPARHGKRLLGEIHVGPDEFVNLNPFDTSEAFGDSHFLPDIADSGRIANLPICPSRLHAPEKEHAEHSPSKHTLVLCTWTASSYHRRGDRTAVNDAPARLREWIVFHKLAGVDHIVIYDNSQSSVDDGSVNSELKRIANGFSDFVTYHPWPAKVCNNNRPNNKNPGERSSQVRAMQSYGLLFLFLLFSS